MRRTVTGIALVALLALANAAAADDAPAVDGTVELSEGSVGVGIGFSWGSGTLTYKGKKYPITASGFQVGDLGATKVRATGEVYNMTDIGYFDGTYSGFEAGATLVAGGDGVTMTNENGVRLRLKGTSEGVKLTFAGDSVVLKIKK